MTDLLPFLASQVRGVNRRGHVGGPGTRHGWARDRFPSGHLGPTDRSSLGDKVSHKLVSQEAQVHAISHLPRKQSSI